MNKTALPSLALAGLLIVGCSTAPPGGTPTPSPTPSPSPSSTPAAPAGLDGRHFLSVSVTEDGAPRPLVRGTQIRLTFGDGDVSAQAGCNIFGGSYSLDGDILIVTGGAMTEMGCDEPRHAQDDWLFTFLGSHPSVQLDGNDLTLTSATVVIKLLDREVAEPDQQLVGPTWVLSSIITGDAVSSIPVGVSPTISFTADGRVEYFSGCNSGGGQYAVDGGRLGFANLVMTDMACAGAAGQVEAEVIAMLAADDIQFSIDADNLTLQAGDLGIMFTAQ
jgi:heat shock protein HslJ